MIDFPPRYHAFEPGATVHPDVRSPSRFLLWLMGVQKWLLLGGAAAGLAWMLPAALSPYVVGRAVDEGILRGDLSATAGWSALLAALIVAGTLLGVLEHTWAVRSWLVALYGTVELVVRKANQLGHVLPRRTPTGEVLSVSSSDSDTFGSVLGTTTRAAASLVVFLLVSGLVLSTSVPLGLTVLVGAPVLVASSSLLLRPLHASRALERQRSSDLTSQATDIVAGLRILRGIGGERTFGRGYAEQSQRAKQAGIRAGTFQGGIDALAVLLSGLLLVVLTWQGAHEMRAGRLSLGDLISFFGYAVFLLGPIRTFFTLGRVWIDGLVAARKTIALLSIQPPWRDQPPTSAPDGDLVDQVSGLVARRGELTVVVSAVPDQSAALADRLGRYLPTGEEPTRPDLEVTGRRARRQAEQERRDLLTRLATADEEAAGGDWGVTLGGVDLARLPLAEVRRRVLVSDTSAALFRGSLQENIDPWGQATRAQAEEALRVACAEDVYDALPDGWQGELEEKGRGLSGGQRQRLVLARALLCDPPVLVLVEPTSAVDAHTEARVAQRLATYRAGKTTVVTTVSPLLLRHADRVVLLEDGLVAAEGSHAELLAGSAAYRQVVGRGMGEAEVGDQPRPGTDGPGTDRVADLVMAGLGPVEASGDRLLDESVAATSAQTWSEHPGVPALPPELQEQSQGQLAGQPWRTRLAKLRRRFEIRRDQAFDFYARSRAPRHGLPVAGSLAAWRFVQQLVRRRPARFWGLLVLNGLAAGAGLVVPRLLGAVIDQVTVDAPVRQTDRLVLVVAGIVGLQALVTFLAKRVAVVFGQNVLADAREHVVRTVLGLPLSRIEGSSTGDLVTRITRDVSTMSAAARDVVPLFLLNAVLVVLSVGAMLASSPLLAAPTLVALGVMWFVVRAYLRLAGRGYIAEGSTYSRINATVSETVEGARTVEALRLGDRRRQASDADMDVSAQAERFTMSLRNVLFLVLDCAFQGPLVGIVVLGAWGYSQGWVSLGQITAAALYSQSLFTPLDLVIQLLDRLQVAAASTTRLLGIAEVPPDREAGPERPEGSALVAERVCFAYREGHDVLHDVSLTLRPGERLAVVGPSGSGKSTLGRLLAGINQPRTGTVTIGGVEATRLPLPVLRTEVALVTQEHHVFVGTIRDNIILAREDSDDEVVREALAAVDALDWVERLPDGLDTRVGSGGTALTPAQAQQVALARLVVADPHTLVLDEATSLIDPRTARHLEGSMHALLSGRTVVAIAHRLHTAHDADRIAVVIDGRIAELGSHTELLALDGEYARLWQAWSGGSQCLIADARAGIGRGDREPTVPGARGAAGRLRGSEVTLS